ncbi:hypothetical protein PO909_020725 [Leuciscus waleckii]
MPTWSPDVQILRLRQENCAIEDYVTEFLELAHLAQMSTQCLMIFFRGGLSEPLRSLMPEPDPHGSLERYVDLALLWSGSLFTVGEEEKKLPEPAVSSQTVLHVLPAIRPATRSVYGRTGPISSVADPPLMSARAARKTVTSSPAEPALHAKSAEAKAVCVMPAAPETESVMPAAPETASDMPAKLESSPLVPSSTEPSSPLVSSSTEPSSLLVPSSTEPSSSLVLTSSESSSPLALPSSKPSPPLVPSSSECADPEPEIHVSPAEPEPELHVTSADPETVHVTSADPETVHVMSADPETVHVTSVDAETVPVPEAVPASPATAQRAVFTFYLVAVWRAWAAHTTKMAASSPVGTPDTVLKPVFVYIPEQVSVSVPEPVVSVPEPVVSVPVPEPVVSVPVPEPVMSVPVPEPVVSVPAPEPVVSVPAPWPPEGSSPPWPPGGSSPPWPPEGKSPPWPPEGKSPPWPPDGLPAPSRSPALPAPPRSPALPAPPRSPALPAPPQSPGPLPLHGPGPPSRPRVRLRSTTLLDNLGASGIRSLKGGYVTVTSWSALESRQRALHIRHSRSLSDYISHTHCPDSSLITHHSHLYLIITDCIHLCPITLLVSVYLYHVHSFTHSPRSLVLVLHCISEHSLGFLVSWFLDILPCSLDYSLASGPCLFCLFVCLVGLPICV